MRHTHKAVWFTVLCTIALSSTGCDKIESVKNYFTGSGEQDAPVSTPAKKIQSTAAPMKADTLARVGNWSISANEFKERLAALKEVIPQYDINNLEAKQLVLDELVNQQILVLGAEKSGLANQSDIKAAVDEFRRTLIVREVARILTENVTMSDEEARQFYEENKGELVDAGQWHVREIVAATKEQANGILSELLMGADFAATAKAKSIAKTAANGGDLGFITEEPFAQMGNALLSLEVGDVSGVFKGPDGFYIVKLEEKKEGEVVPFDKIKDDIIQSQLLIKQQEIIMNHLDRLKSEIPVEINEQLL